MKLGFALRHSCIIAIRPVARCRTDTGIVQIPPSPASTSANARVYRSGLCNIPYNRNTRGR